LWEEETERRVAGCEGKRREVGRVKLEELLKLSVKVKDLQGVRWLGEEGEREE
jgi:hypothetical protein